METVDDGMRDESVRGADMISERGGDALWTSAEAAKATGGRARGQIGRAHV